MVPELVVTTYSGAPVPWGELGGKMGARPTRRPVALDPGVTPVVVAVVMMVVEVVEVVEAVMPTLPVAPAAPTECVMILAPAPVRKDFVQH